MKLRPIPARLEVGQFEQVSRILANNPLSLFLINGQPYIATGDAAVVMEVHEKTFRNHLDTIYLEESSNTRGGVERPPLQSYQVPVFIQSTSDTGRGGGTQYLTVYPLSVFLKAARRMRNAKRQDAILDEVDAIYLEYQQHGFVVSQYAVDNDQAAAEAFHQKKVAFNYSSERYAMLELNKRIDMLFFYCIESVDSENKVNYALHSYFRKCCHNTAHIATTGTSALQILASRADPNQLNFGQVNYLGKNAPRENELNNACNFLTNFELIARSGVVDRNLGWLMTEVTSRGKIPMHEMLCKFTKYSSGGPFLSFISDKWDDYAETALTNILNMLDTSMLRAEFRVKVDAYKLNFPNRHTMTVEQRQEFNLLEQALVTEVLNMTTDGNLQDYYAQVSQV